MTTVLTLEPLDMNLLGNTLKLQLGGKPCRGRPVVKVDYKANFAKDSIDGGVRALDAAIKNTSGPKLVFAHSQGAQVVSRWLRLQSKTTVIPEVAFLLIGNPLRKYGGYIIGRPEVGGQVGLPTPNDTLYPVTDVKMQYDGWADWPTGTGLLARVNARNGQNGRHCYGYLAASLDDPARKVYVEGTTTYVMLPGKPTYSWIPQSLIEREYSRPER